MNGRQTLRRLLPWLPIGTLLFIFLVGIALVLTGTLVGVTVWYALQLLLPLLGLIFLLALAIYALWKRGFNKVIAINFVVSLLALLPVAILLGLWPVTYPAIRQWMKPAATVRLPADVPLKIGWGGDNVRVNYHAASPDQRWAYDLLVEPYLTGSSELADYGCYGITVVAPASGQVIVAQDGAPDEVPGVLSNNIANPEGNHVVIELPTNTYLLLAHLRQGSVVVQEGEMVEEGQPIGECGNSGNTSEPHIHIHHQRQNPADYPISFANGLPLYFRDHNGPPMPEGGLKVENGQAIAIGPKVQHQGP